MSVVNGKSGLLGSLLASITVMIFLSIHLLLARISRDLDPMATMALAMFSYFAKVIFMGVFLLLVTKFTDRSTVDRASFAICTILITMAWLFGEIRSFLKLRVNLPLPKKEGQS
jgi:ATP synthase protein I